MVKKSEIKELKTAAKLEIELIENEYEEILKKTQKSKKNSQFQEFEDILGDEKIKELYIERKDRKYAALVIELYAILEQLLKKLYSLYNPDENYRNSSNNNVILDLERRLNLLDFKNNTKTLADLRKFIVHDEFSLKSARKKHAKKYKNNKELFTDLLSDTRTYIISIKVK